MSSRADSRGERQI